MLMENSSQLAEVITVDACNITPDFVPTSNNLEHGMPIGSMLRTELKRFFLELIVIANSCFN